MTKYQHLLIMGRQKKELTQQACYSFKKVGTWLASGNRDFKRLSTTLPGKNGSQCLNCANSMAYAEHPFSFWESRILYVLGRVKETLETLPGFLQTLSHESLSFANSALYPFAVINHPRI